jgi:intracellular septation protein
MQAALNLAPLLAFWFAYKWGGIYVATAVLMGSMVLLLLVDLLRTRTVSPLHAISTLLVLALGTATLVLHDARFLKWKPTVFLWLLALIFLGSQWVGASPLTRRLIEPALPPGSSLGTRTWNRANIVWVLFYIALGAANLLVAYRASESTWVAFKVYGMTAAFMVFAVIQALWLGSRATGGKPADEQRPG